MLGSMSGNSGSGERHSGAREWPKNLTPSARLHRWHWSHGRSSLQVCLQMSQWGSVVGLDTQDVVYFVRRQVIYK